ncbi:MAG: ribbon-helix-helix protein, CopG family [Dehalococcoidia bacterium]
MKRRRSILLDEELDRRVERRARERGTTYTEAVREVLQEHFSEAEENPNQWLLDLAQEISALPVEARVHGPFRPIDDPDEQDRMARDQWRRNMNREPDW